MNRITLHGRLTRDPSLKEHATGNKSTMFTVAVPREYKNADGTRPADFIPCVAWNKLGEIISANFHKGDEILLIGRLQHRNYSDEAGNQKLIYEVIVSEIDFVGNRKKEGTTSLVLEPNELDEITQEMPYEL